VLRVATENSSSNAHLVRGSYFHQNVKNIVSKKLHITGLHGCCNGDQIHMQMFKQNQNVTGSLRFQQANFAPEVAK
jgi:hypothetical protein